MEKKLEVIVKDYDNCMSFKHCENCHADQRIEGTESTWCDFLRQYTSSILDKIDNAIFG